MEAPVETIIGNYDSGNYYSGNYDSGNYDSGNYDSGNFLRAGETKMWKLLSE
jgi:hypothetical protein